ncbi:MAG: hypothetical protein Q4C66_07095 [Lachnospiraceae bacterium]|nr:hypothetical protein [Lachnospiraceae bacterium]
MSVRPGFAVTHPEKGLIIFYTDLGLLEILDSTQDIRPFPYLSSTYENIYDLIAKGDINMEDGKLKLAGAASNLAKIDRKYIQEHYDQYVERLRTKSTKVCFIDTDTESTLLNMERVSECI